MDHQNVRRAMVTNVEMKIAGPKRISVETVFAGPV
jgi:hypothetical protein